MPETIVTYRCMIISPSDVEEERDIVEEVVRSWNAHVGVGLRARVEAVRWESHARPEMGKHPQEIINQQLVDDCDFGIALFWSRLGSPTREHESGSAEEVARLLARGARVIVYFCDRPIPQKSGMDEQFKKLQELKSRYLEQGLLGEYSEPEDLRSIVNLHITGLMTQLLVKNNASGQPIPTTGTLTAPAPDIRVSTRVAVAIVGGTSKTVLSIGVENHSPVRFFTNNVVLETSSGSQILVARDCLTGDQNGRRELEPGDSFGFHFEADSEFWEMVDEERPVCAAVNDSIRRVFRGSAEELRSALQSLRKKRS